jgi:hypothetical protein
MRIGLCGPTYRLASLNVDCQDTVNWYPTALEMPNTKTRISLDPTPGKKLVATLPESPCRGEVFVNGRHFAVGGKRFCELDARFQITVRNGALDLVDDKLPVSFGFSNTQILIQSASRAYYFDLRTNAFGEVDTLSGNAVQGPVSRAKYSDGYFMLLLRNSRKWQISGLLDVTSWDPLDIDEVSLVSDNLLSFDVDHREPWFFSPTQTVPYYNSGNADFPYSPVGGAFIEDGLAAANSIAKLDNSLFWIAADQRGQGIARRAQGYTPIRVSNFAIEFGWSQYPTLSDAIGYAYQEQGHTQWVISFPTANKTWAYDAASQLWHRRGVWNGNDYDMDLAQFHAFAFQKHIVGGLKDGKLYEQSIAYNTDDETPIRRMRRAPAIANEDQWIYFERLTVDVEVGLGPQPPLIDGEGNPRGPEMMVRWSNDSAKTWSNEMVLGCGQAGEYATQVYLNRLGRARKGRVFEISTTDPIPWRIASGYVEATPSFSQVQ